MAGLRDVRDRVAIVTGASSGIGEALARELARRGARVALVARRRERLQALADAIERDGGRALAIAADVSRREAVADAVETALARWSRIDLLVNAAGSPATCSSKITTWPTSSACSGRTCWAASTRSNGCCRPCAPAARAGS